MDIYSIAAIVSLLIGVIELIRFFNYAKKKEKLKT